MKRGGKTIYGETNIRREGDVEKDKDKERRRRNRQREKERRLLKLSKFELKLNRQ